MEFKRVTDLCRELRKNETPQERRLWKELRNRNFFGTKFRRQHPFIYQSVQGKKDFFIADFYCREKQFLVELDGRVHDFQKDYDANRDKVLLQLGLKTIRITNDELENDMKMVLKKIESEILVSPDLPIKTK